MINLELLQKQNEPSLKVKSLIDSFVSIDGVGRRYLFGRNEHSAALAKIFDIDGFIDDFAEKGTIWENKPVLHGSKVPKNGIIINCVMMAKPRIAQERINALNISGSITYSDILYLLPNLVAVPKFIQETKLDLIQNLHKWERLVKNFNDNESLKVIFDLLRYRLTGNYTFLEGFNYRPEDQYFDKSLEFGSKEIFVDAGGFDGDTTELFCIKNPDYEKVFLFEPDPINLDKAKIRLKGYRTIQFFELGVSDINDTLWFNPDNGSASSIGDSGSCKINVTTIDQAVDTKVTFIKMDLEGWELKALIGSKNHIIQDHPKLAIAVYHNPSDFWRIYDYIFSLRQDYNVFLRHYTEGWIETIMYFVPK